MKLKSNCPICGKEYIPNKNMTEAETIAKIIYEKTASYTRSNTNNGLERKPWIECSESRQKTYFNAAHSICAYYLNTRNGKEKE